MTKRMLIDATHQEETRVVMLDGHRLEDVDFESASKRPIKGNIYLARVTRVEPSLQAAFVEYGGNRHGFLAFSEIHPDYYRIPVEDQPGSREAPAAQDAEVVEDDADESDAQDQEPEGQASEAQADNGDDDGDTPAEASDGSDDPSDSDGDGEEDGEEAVESLGGDEAEEVARKRPRNYRNYKIQEVIKRKQILLVQAVKEERGNKGAALTTYLSLPGRYCVLMPNTARGGGVSRKITNANDRKRIKKIVDDLSVPEGMAVIVRTAGSERTKAEIKRDFDYLMRLWSQIRNDTLNSVAPTMIYEEGTLIKRSLRDVYTSDVEEVLVDGDDGYKTAKDFMKSLIPSHARKIKRYKDIDIPMFQRFQVESQLDAMHNPTVQLRSGGYLVINQTEALVAIDVNSGRATRERHIEETAVKTNLEAADEVARQLRLRDLAGLVVIDFIDMEENRHQNQVERRLKEAMKSDRARIQIGRISAFGLLELSRQRLRPSLIESSAQPCTVCGGLGWVRSPESSGLQVLRAIEEEGTRKRAEKVIVAVPTRIALYLLNEKRAAVIQIEERYGVSVVINADETIIPPQVYKMERVTASGDVEEAETSDGSADMEDRGRNRRGGRGRGRDRDRDRDDNRSERSDRNSDRNPDRGDRNGERGERNNERGERGGRGRRGGRRNQPEEIVQDEEENVQEIAAGDEAETHADEPATQGGERPEAGDGDGDDQGNRKRRRRGRRGGRRRRGRRGEEQDQESAENADSENSDPENADQNGDSSQSEDAVATDAPADIVIDARISDEDAEKGGASEANDNTPSEEDKPKPKRASRTRRKKAEPADEATDLAPDEASVEARDSAPEEKPKRAPRTRRKKVEPAEGAPETAADTTPDAETEEKPKPKRAPRTRRKKTEAPAPEPTASEPTASELTPSEPAASEPAAAPAPSTLDAPLVGENKPVEIEGPDAASDAKPKRKGWWSRITGS